ncbi:uncharacterized protein [Diadema setosum]|uniref:uncharacterized protein n=1 Tax=Diadema setosum TaxID=31175 RepID=UPI003B3B2449
MADSTKKDKGSGATKKFAIPSIADIAQYETRRPKIQSSFRAKHSDKQQEASTSSSASTAQLSKRPIEPNERNRNASSSSSASSSHRGGDLPRNAGSFGESRNSEKSTSVGNRTGENSANVSRTGQGNSEVNSSGREATAGAVTTGASAADDPPASTSEDQGAGTSGPKPRVQFQSAADFVKKRGKIGAAFADKFRLLGRAEEYQVPVAVAAQQASGSAVAGGASSAGQSKAASGNSIIVNPRQRGNPILKYIRNVPWEFGDIVPDYVVGRTACAFYLSLRYHHLNPNYIHDRLMELGHRFDLRVLLVQVDVKDPHHSVKELARLAILADCTLILAWSSEEAGRYLETYKAYENKSADALKEKIEQDHLSKVTDCLTTVKSVNRTDVITLLANYGTFDKVVAASKEELALLPGFGQQKAQRLCDSFTEPFLRKNKKRKTEDEEEGR